MVMLKTPQEIEIMHSCNQIVAEIRDSLKKMVRPGMTTLELDSAAEEMILKSNAKPAFKGYRGYPRTICVSVNQEVVHGIPGNRKLNEGDIVGIDMGVIFNGYYGDSAVTVAVGKVSKSAEKLMKVTEESLYKGIEAAQAGNHLHDIGAAVQEHCENNGFSVVRDFVGHGIGKSLHEDPQVPNYGKKGTGMKLVTGMVLAIEPMVNEGGPAVKILDDGWTAVTADGKLSAHFEHSIAITEKGPVILSMLN
jgi:methionyl aminopeptidase